MSRARAAIHAVIRAASIDPAAAGRRLDRAAAEGWAFRARAHLACAMIACFFITWPILFVELCGAPLLVNSLIGLRFTRRAIRDVILQPHMLLLIVWALWGMVSLAWSRDPRGGLDELANLRWFLLVPLIWPSIQHRRTLLICFAAGVVAGNISQVSHLFGARFDVAWLRFQAMPDRNPGWWPPVAGAVILCAAMGMHLSAAAIASGRTRALASAASLVTFWGILASGTRGAWVVAAVLTLLAITLAVVGAWRRRRGWAGALLLVGASVGGFALAGATVGPILVQRTSAAVREVRGAIERDEYQTPAGARVLMARAALDAFLAHPVQGLGAGGYRSWLLDAARSKGIDDPVAELGTHDHAHCMPLHIAAVGGIVGLGIAGGLAGVMLWSLVRRPQDDLGGYRLAPAGAFVGLLLAGAFDVIHVNDQTSAALAALVALCPPVMPTRAGAATTPR